MSVMKRDSEFEKSKNPESKSFSTINSSKEELFVYVVYIALTHSMALVSFSTHRKHHKTSGFPMFSEGIERQVTYEKFTS